MAYPLFCCFRWQLFGKILSDQEVSSEASAIINESEEKFKNLFDHLIDVVIVVSPQGNIISANPAFENVSGWSVNEYLNKPYYDLVHPDDVQIVEKNLKQLLEEKEVNVFEIRIICKSGENKIVEINPSLLTIGNTIIGALGIIRDITERKRSEEALKESEKFLKETQKIAQLGSYVFDVKTGIWKSSEILDSIFGISKDFNRSVEGWVSIIHPEWQQMMSDYLTKKVIGAKKSFDKEYKIIRNNDKAVRWVHGLGILVYNKDNEPIEMVGTIRDITERKNSEEEYKKLSIAVEQSPASVVITNQQGEIEYVNKKFCEVTGYSKEEAIGNNPRILKSGLQQKEFYEELWKTILSGKGWNGELQNKKKNGEIFWESAQISPLLNKDGEITSYIAIKEDITDRKLEQEELIKAKEEAEEMNRLKNNFLSSNSPYWNSRLC